MTAQSEFLAEIVASPGDLTARLIYADWLEEQGDPRGEFIRIQCELSEPSEDFDRREVLDRRQDHLRRLHERDWTGIIRNMVSGWSFRCGFVEAVEITAEQFLQFEDRLRNCAPIRSLTIVGAEGLVTDVLKRPLIRQLEAFKIEHSHLSRLDAVAIAEVEFQHLQTIRFCECNLTNDSFEPLLQLQTDRLKDVDLSINKLRNASLEGIAESPVFANLTDLNLLSNEIRQTGAKALAESRGMQALQFLDIRGNMVGRTALELLLKRFGDAVRL